MQANYETVIVKLKEQIGNLVLDKAILEAAYEDSQAENARLTLAFAAMSPAAPSDVDQEGSAS